MSATLSYVFCLVRGTRRPILRGTEGMPGGAGLRALDVAPQLWAIVETVPERDYGETALAAGLLDLDWVGLRAIAHESVIERFLTAPALLPMQLFTLFTSDDRVVKYILRDRRRITRILKRVEGKVEWGIRLMWNEQAARTKVERRHARASTRAIPGDPRHPRGAAYLARKRDMLDVNRVQLAAARAEATRVYGLISRQAVDAVRRTSTERAAPGSRLLLDAAFLVRSTRAATFRAEVRTHVRQLRLSGVAVSLTGPWPAYNFITP